jgi:hypothetical protein
LGSKLNECRLSCGIFFSVFTSVVYESTNLALPLLFPQAIPCALTGVKPGGRKPEKPPSVYWGEQQFGGEKFKATFLDEVGEDPNKRWRVSLVAQDGRSVADQITCDGYVLHDSGESNPRQHHKLV